MDRPGRPGARWRTAGLGSFRPAPPPLPDRNPLVLPARMTARIEARFDRCRADGRPALATYVMAGDPDPETSLAVLKALPQAGADIVELGLPFTDPMADGPAIQAAGLRALKAGQNTSRTLDLVRRFRARDADTPIILMGYFNPIHSYGVMRFLKDAKAAGVDGFI